MCEIFSDPYQEAGFEKKTENVCEKEIKEEELRKEGGREGGKEEGRKEETGSSWKEGKGCHGVYKEETGQVQETRLVYFPEEMRTTSFTSSSQTFITGRHFPDPEILSPV